MSEMTKEQRIAARAEVARTWGRIWDELYQLQIKWEMLDWPPDLMAEDEWPFHMSLEDITAEVNDASERASMVNELMQLEPVTMTVSREEFERLLVELDRPERVLPRLKALLEGHDPKDGNRLWR